MVKPNRTASEAPASSTILIVDDDVGLLRLIDKRLRREGYQTAAFDSGAAVIEWARQHEADLLLLDLKLEEMEGKELLEKLRLAQRSIPFIVITGQGDERVAVELMKLGAVDYLVKDRHFLDFLPSIVGRALQQVQQERQLAAAEQALKREHEFITTLLNTTGALVIVLDTRGRIVRFNPACERTTGYHFDEVQSQDFLLFIPPEEQNEVRAIFERLVAGQPRNEHENHWRTRSGELRLITWSNAVLTGSDGATEYIIATGLDISEHKRLEKEILQISDMEQRRLGQDLHDGLCQHLAGIEMMSQVLEQKLAPRSKANAAIASEIALLVRQGISHTRDLARGLSPVMLESEGLMSALQELAGYTERIFRVECRCDYPEPVLIEDNNVATHLYRITQEAISNAVKHGKATRIHVQLQADPDSIHLSVRDNGRGLSRDVPHKGMGLRIMDYRARMIGASLKVVNQENGGAAVFCHLKRRALSTPSLL